MNKQTHIVFTELLHSIDQKNFDLEVWKIKATLVIKKVFGDSDEKLKLIEALHYDYSSWSLRDQNGTRQSDTIKEKAKGIIEAAILELSLDVQPSTVFDELQKLLIGEEMSQLQQLMEQKKGDETAFIEFFSKISSAVKDRILSRLILKAEQ